MSQDRKQGKQKIQFKLVHPNAEVPKRATDGSAGYDLMAASITWHSNPDKLDLPSYDIEIDVGVAVSLPPNTVGLIFPRSSLSKTPYSFANAVGVLDSDYSGTLKVRLREDFDRLGSKYVVGDRVAQLVIVPIVEVGYEVVETLSNESQSRGSGGFGSTGR